jgi:hypothetical protein
MLPVRFPLTLHPVQTLEATIIERRVRLVLLDSVASLARADFAAGSLPERQRMLGQQVGCQRQCSCFSCGRLVTLVSCVTKLLHGEAPVQAASLAVRTQGSLTHLNPHLQLTPLAL